MAYGTHYYINFKGRNEQLYTFKIQQLDYAGPQIELLGAMPAVVIEKQVDDPFAAIQGTGATVQYINELNIPLSTFYTENDREWIGRLELRDGTLIWQGYLIQEDSEEPYAPAPYTVQLRFTDGLAEAENVRMNEAAAVNYTDVIRRDAPISNNTIQIANILFDPLLEVGDTIIVDNGIYSLVSYTWVSNTLTLVVTGLAKNGIFPVTIRYRENLLTKITLLSYIRYLLESTGHTLPLRIFCNVIESSTDNTAGRHFLDQTRVYSGAYLQSNGDWDNVREIADGILTRFGLVLVQAEGYWNIIRWAEAYRYADGEIPGTEYDEDMQVYTVFELDPTFTDCEPINANAVRRIRRPYKYVQETFNYEQPRELIYNINLREVGEELDTYTDGDGNTVTEYEAPGWNEIPTAYNPEIFIRVISNTEEGEINRYLVLKGAISGGPYIRSSSFPMFENDRVDISCQVRTSDSQTGVIQLTQVYRLEGATDYYIQWNASGEIDGTWKTTTGTQIEILADQDTQNWFNFTVESLGAPAFGYFDLGLGQLDSNGTINETHYKDFRITYKPYITDANQVIGHRHTGDNNNEAVPVYEQDIKIDDAPRLAWQGVMVTDTDTNGRYDTLTELWNFPGRLNNKLGEALAKERAGLFSTSRLRIEGEFTFDDAGFSFIKLFQFAGKRLILSNVLADYSNSTFTGELNELYADGETEYTNVDYTFEYLYERN